MLYVTVHVARFVARCQLRAIEWNRGGEDEKQILILCCSRDTQNWRAAITHKRSRTTVAGYLASAETNYDFLKMSANMRNVYYLEN